LNAVKVLLEEWRRGYWFILNKPEAFTSSIELCYNPPSHKNLRTTTNIRPSVAKRKACRNIPRSKGPDEKEELKLEIVALRKEVKELREAVNLLMEMVMEHGEPEEFEVDYGDFRMDKNNRLPLGM
jgi:hypothetical protein